MEKEQLWIIATALTVHALKGLRDDKAKIVKKAAIDRLVNLWTEEDSQHQLSPDDTIIETNIVRNEVPPEET